ncbi:hypothetical protein [Flavobacterium salmonis]|uniref:Uncharacterized protein n=1 Tax=Flavobacterium salmonis TaxID=2654844 RepID=A0A6V6Z9K7_9FLAO|nr:hypothetical protein [Flavobacterium salmonis]CAD0007592.1 hypothetical protein FLAT13_03920 [Flavobacterium salmonis]
MIKKIITLIVFLNSLLSFSQIANDSLINSIKKAEKIVLASHEDFYFIREEEGNGKTTLTTLLKIENPSKRIRKKIKRRFKKLEEKRAIVKPLLKNGKPNKSIIREKIELDSKLKQELIEVISKQKNDILYDGNYCFEPHHTIFIYRKKKWSYIDLCFGCDHYSYSEDLNINKKYFLVTYEDWRNLEAFFRNQNLNYRMQNRK